MKKKSLLVVPALGVLLLAAAGSVGGTVAWFSSASSVDQKYGVFQAKAMDGNLSIEATPIAAKGTVAGAGDLAVQVKSNCFLTHASYDHANDAIFTRSSETKSGVRVVVDEDASPTPLTNWVAKSAYDGTENHDIYWAVSWTLTFSYDFATENAAYLFFDPTSSLAATSAAIDETEGKKNVIDGFRIAMVAADGTIAGSSVATRVWGKRRATSNYIDQTTAATKEAALSENDYTSGSPYTGSTFIGSGFSTKYDEGTILTVDKSSDVGYLGKFVKPDAPAAARDDIVITCVAWFEGTDSSIVSSLDTVFNSITAHMKFYAREYKAPAPEPEP